MGWRLFWQGEADNMYMPVLNIENACIGLED